METLHIRLEKPPSGGNHAGKVEGRTIVQNWDKLHAVANEMKIKWLGDYLSSENDQSRWYSTAEAAQAISRLMSQIGHQRALS